MYAIVKTGGKQYRVEEGQSLLVERLPVDDGGKAVLEPLLFVDGSNVVDGDELAKVSVEARVLGHERGPKLRVVKFKPKRGYKRRTGHRQELTRIEVTSIKLGSRRGASGGRAAAKPAAAEGEAAAGAEEKPTRARERSSAGAGSSAAAGEKPARARSRAKPKSKPEPESTADEPKTEEGNGA
jgi:large subunit ribosomal protein L21